MNFGDLINIAKRNDDYNKTNAQVKRYSTQVSAAKKETPKSRALSNSIQQFLAKKEEEERQKQQDALIQKEKLMALRAKDKKANKRVRAMINMNKGASKAVLDDAKQAASDAPVSLEAQPDEDDYGFVSEESSEVYKRIMMKYQQQDNPRLFSPKSQPKVGDLGRTKDRVKEAIRKAQEEESGGSGVRRRRRHAGEDAGACSDEDEFVSTEETKQPASSAKSRPKLPPPPSFQQILQLAQEKQGQAPPPPPVPKNVPEEFEFERPMTKKEKLEFMREQESKLRRQGKLPRKEPPPQPAAPPKSKMAAEPQMKAIPKIPKRQSEIPTIPKKNSQEVKPQRPLQPQLQKTVKPTAKPEPQFKAPPSKSVPVKAESRPVPVRTEPKSQMKSELRQFQVKTEPKLVQAKSESKGDHDHNQFRFKNQPKAVPGKSESRVVKGKTEPVLAQAKPRPVVNSNDRPVSRPAMNAGGRPVARPAMNASGRPVARPASERPAGRPAVNANDQSVSRPAVNANNRPVSRPPMNANDRPVSRPAMNRPSVNPGKQSQVNRPGPHSSQPRPMGSKKPAFANKRRIESDEEYDSEMDDFIDDGPQDGVEDISRHIKEIFGYDRNRYRGNPIEDEEECMESSFSQQMKEEYISTKHGILEDLEDIQREADEKKRMVSRKKIRLK